jgi:hypothetical protein
MITAVLEESEGTQVTVWAVGYATVASSSDLGSATTAGLSRVD